MESVLLLLLRSIDQSEIAALQEISQAWQVLKKVAKVYKKAVRSFSSTDLAYVFTLIVLSYSDL